MPGKKKKVTEAEVSLDDLRSMLRVEINKKYPRPQGHPDGRWIKELFLDHVIVEDEADQKLYSVPFTLSEDNVELDFESEVEVEQEYVPVKKVAEAAEGEVDLQIQATITGLAEAKDNLPEGSIWEVEIIREGLSSNRTFYPASVVKQIAKLAEGANVLMRPDEEHIKDQGKSVERIVGWITDTKFKKGSDGITRAYGLLNLSEAEDKLRIKILDAWNRGKRDLLGLSIVGDGFVKLKRMAEGLVRYVGKMKTVDSVDIVVDPAAGGRLRKLVAAESRQEREELEMKDKLLKLIEAKRPTLLKSIDIESVTEEELLAKLAEALDASEKEVKELAEKEDDTSAGEGQEGTPDRVAEAEQRILLTESRIVLREKLAESKLPEVTQAKIRKQFDDKVFEQDELDQAIEGERGYLATLSESGRVEGLGEEETGAQAGLGTRDKIGLAMDQLLGLEIEEEVPRLSGIREAYIELSGDTEISGEFKLKKLTEAISSSTFSYLLGASMHRRLVTDYNEVDYGEGRIISVIPAPDFKTREAIRVGYFGDLDTVDPETADYAEITAAADEEATYSVGQKGNILTITRKTIINDDLGFIRRVPQRLGRAAKRTFARFVWTFFIGNANIYDAVAWFAAGHSNLGSDALAIAALQTAITAMRDQTEPGSSEKLHLNPVLLVVPTALEWTAKGINTSRLLPGSANNDANPLFGKFGENNENILVNPLLTDANDWGLFADPKDIDIIEVGFLNGQEEPEMFLSDTPTQGLMFTSDKIQYKIRHEYGGVVVDYRGAYKAVVA